MIALDTNVLLRLFVSDHAEQHAMVRHLVAGLTPERPGFVAREVLLELVWVLGSSYCAGRDRIAGILRDLSGIENVTIEGEIEMLAVLEPYRQGHTGFADLMILAAARRAGCETLCTFDRRLARQDGATLLETT